MISVFPRVPLLLLCLVLVGAGCTSSRPATSDSSSRPTPVARGSSACEHPYYPLRPGYQVRFQNTYSGPDRLPHTSHYTWSVTGSSVDSVDLALRFEEDAVSSTQHLRCTARGIEATAYVDLSAARGRGTFRAQTKNATGIYLPHDLHVGSEWSQSFDIVMRPVSGGDSVMGAIEGTVSVRRKALAEESVTVPAGTYSALKVETHTSIDLGRLAGLPDASGALGDIVTIEWWVRDVGLIKTAVTMGEGTAAATAEAVQITLP